MAVALALCLLLALGGCGRPFRETIQGSGDVSEHRRLAFDEPLAQPLLLRVRGIAVAGALSRLENHMSITIFDDTAQASSISADPYSGRITIETDGNINALINVVYDFVKIG